MIKATLKKSLQREMASEVQRVWISAKWCHFFDEGTFESSRCSENRGEYFGALMDSQSWWLKPIWIAIHFKIALPFHDIYDWINFFNSAVFICDDFIKANIICMEMRGKFYYLLWRFCIDILVFWPHIRKFAYKNPLEANPALLNLLHGIVTFDGDNTSFKFRNNIFNP